MRIRVLLVDDEKSFADILSKRLEIRDFEVTSVFSGEEAVELLQEQEFDVVLLDVLMPGKSGIDTLKEIIKIDPLAHIIMLTGHARVDTAMEGMKLGAYDYLIKPAEVDELVEKIELAHYHKISQKERTQPPPVPGRDKRRGLGRLISTVHDLFSKNQPSKSEHLQDKEIETDRDES